MPSGRFYDSYALGVRWRDIRITGNLVAVEKAKFINVTKDRTKCRGTPKIWFFIMYICDTQVVIMCGTKAILSVPQWLHCAKGN